MGITYALVYAFDPAVAGPTEAEYEEWVAFEQAARDAGQLVHGAGLYPPAAGRSVRVRDGRASVEDITAEGEVVAGYYVVDVPDEAAAIELAQRIPAARYGRVDVRQITEMA